MEKIEITGKYAIQRRDVLKAHAPEMYNSMLSDGTLAGHLDDVQETVSHYVDMSIERYKLSREYLAAEAENPAEAMRLLNAKILEVEDTAFRTWIANVPDEEVKGNEEDDENE